LTLPASLAISIVVFKPDLAWLTRTLATLVAALRHAQEAGVLHHATVVLVDNESTSRVSPHITLMETHLRGIGEWLQWETLSGHGNLGYGAGNNLAIERYRHTDVHLILNPDVACAPGALTAGLQYLQAEPHCAMVSPVAITPDGEPLFHIKDYPSLAVLGLRGFAPDSLRRRFAPYMRRYERGSIPFDAPILDARLVSGCFMLTRRWALDRTGGFDPSFFLYFEDFDLSLRISELAPIHRVPACRIEHGGGHAARKGARHIRLFIVSAFRFYMRYGWRLI
jgi:GT2 family glycosyltransferase